MTRSTSGAPGMSDDMMAKMSPEQRAKVEEMMKQRGMSMSGNTTVVKSCVTKDKVAKGSAFSDNRENCTHSVVSASSNHLEVKIHCDETRNGKRTTTDGSTSIDISGDGVKGTNHFVVNTGDRTMNMDSTFTSKYLGAACGDVK